MDYLKNTPENPEKLSTLIDIRPGQIISMALSKTERVQITLFGVAEGESISEEAYNGDTFYYVLDGEMILTKEDIQYSVNTGECVSVPAKVLHAISGQNAFKFMQITIC